MHRIDGPGHQSGHFTDGDPVAGTRPTQVNAAWAEAVQEEILAVIEATGQIPIKGNHTQLLDALSAGLINPWANKIINPRFRWWQRFSEPTPSTTILGSDSDEEFGPDRWIVDPGDGASDVTVSRQTFALGVVPVGLESEGQPVHYLRWRQNFQSTSQVPRLHQRIEGVRTFAGLQVSISFLARATDAIDVTPFLAQDFGTGGSPSTRVELTATPISLTTTWTRYVVTFTLGTMSGKTIGTNGNDRLEVGLKLELLSGFNGEDLEITDWRIGPGATTNNTILVPNDVDLLRCQRYYQKSYSPLWAPGEDRGLETAVYGMALGVTTGTVEVTGANARLRVPMRVPMGAAVNSLARPSTQTDGLQIIWAIDAAPPYELGDVTWNGTEHAATGIAGTEDALNRLEVTDPGFTTVEPWGFNWSADAEIVDNGS